MEMKDFIACGMDTSIIFIALLLLQSPLLISSTTTFDSLQKGSSLSIDQSSNVLDSRNGVYSAGFFEVGNNAFTFAVWFTKSSPPTAAWMANRDQPVNGKGSKLSLLSTGDLFLTDAGGIPIWNSKTSSASPVHLILLNTGNLVLVNSKNVTLWESFNSPTDTLLPDQEFTKDKQLVSSRSQGNCSSGFYKFYFDNDNILRLLYNGPEISSVYWPDPAISIWNVGRSPYNNTRIAVFNKLGHFTSSDNVWFQPSDFGLGPKRRLTLDFDGNMRMYSLEEATGTWSVSLQFISQPCTIHGTCGPNSLCSHFSESGRKCSCLPGFKIINPTDWSQGCELQSKIDCNSTETGFIQVPHLDFYGYDIRYMPNSTIHECEKECLQTCNCQGFMFKFFPARGVYDCFPKFLLFNGQHSPNFEGIMYLKLPQTASSSISNNSSFQRVSADLTCSGEVVTELARLYEKPKENESVRFLLWFAYGIGGIEITCIFLVWFFLYRNNSEPDAVTRGYMMAATGFKKFSYNELKKATKGFTEEIGRGGGGVVYKGTLSDGRIAAIKRLNEAANQGEAEFLAEVSTIGKLNHMNLIEMWGYCAERKERLLVYEYMKHGSLAENLSSNSIGWENRFEIAVGTAKGLSYLHEECLEWILHCDIKPQNILLDSNYKPKVADFGLSKLLNRGVLNSSNFSRIRGTRGYMAPEWVYNLPITSKVDVYSYGVVVLEMVTGKSPTGIQTWVKEKMNEAATRDSWIEEIVDPSLGCEYNATKMELLIRVALQCLKEDKDARPTMSQVVEMLQCNEDDLLQELSVA